MKSRSNRQGAAVRTLAVIGLASVMLGLLQNQTTTAVRAGTEPQAGTTTTYAQVAPILQSQCANCHNPQGGAPFSLLTYDDAKQWGGQILDVTQSRYMPPWLPATGKGDFAGARRLSDAELAAIRAWVGAGTPAGTVSEAPAPVSEQEWALGKPDAVLTLAEPVTVPGNGSDIFTTFVAPFAIDGVHSLRAIQIRPSDPQAVRSVWLSFDARSKTQQTDGSKQGVASMEPPESTQLGTAGLVFWSPGSQALKPRPGESWTTKPGGDLQLTTHLKTTGKKLALQFQIGLYYENRTTNTGHAAVLTLDHRGPIEIPAGAAATVVQDSYTLPEAVSATAIYPRAHFLAHTFEAYATTPAGKQVWLLSIPNWDVDWLEVYTYRRPVALPKGSVIHWMVSYDNSAENPHNPSDPPVAVTAGPTAKDEADKLLLEVVPPPGANAVEWRKRLGSAAQ